MTGQRFSPRHRGASRSVADYIAQGASAGASVMVDGRDRAFYAATSQYAVGGRNRQLPADLFDGKFEHAFPVLPGQPRRHAVRNEIPARSPVARGCRGPCTVSTLPSAR